MFILYVCLHAITYIDSVFSCVHCIHNGMYSLCLSSFGPFLHALLQQIPDLSPHIGFMVLVDAETYNYLSMFCTAQVRIVSFACRNS